VHASCPAASGLAHGGVLTQAQETWGESRSCFQAKTCGFCASKALCTRVWHTCRRGRLCGEAVKTVRPDMSRCFARIQSVSVFGVVVVCIGQAWPANSKCCNG